ncbi:MFS general substrate transporter [Punctularia strigosozonata HHB-11173 SS5]|uniref:MFS general substrate transporter n=1 Tax=Punctularia strigosozonata (strain HHB-11173) TaxID=741275 RepID=UPI0004417287|nr:MFS general substrate transporter [Punctularia strigosozonata HHB-11173 SS5]EIN08528.1 MFS general substrate transporter [Punctularia strigosozonata HHB-11173 SS5]
MRAWQMARGLEDKKLVAKDDDACSVDAGHAYSEIHAIVAHKLRRTVTDEKTTFEGDGGNRHNTETTEEELLEEDFLEGGLRAWLTVAGASLTLFATFGYLYSFGVYQDYYTRIYLVNRSPSVISWIGSTQLMFPFLLGLVSGKLFDEGYFHHLIAAGSILFTFSYGLVALFQTASSLAAGIVLVGNSCGAIAFPIMINQLLNIQGRSFGDSVRDSPYVLLGVLIVGNLLMRPRLPLRRLRKPQDLPPPPKMSVLLTDWPYMVAILAGLVASLAFYFPVFYIQLFGLSHGVDSTLSFYSVALLNGASAFGRLIANWLADRYGPFNVLVPSCLFSGALIIAMLGVTSSAASVVVSLLYGFFSGAFLSLTVALIAALSANASEIGVRTGVTFTTQCIATLVAAPTQGQFLTRSQFKWGRPIAYSAVYRPNFLP